MERAVCCRSCRSPQLERVIDLGHQPLANNLLRPEHLNEAEPVFPLEVRVCTACWLMQIAHAAAPTALFTDYVYFSSYSDEMLQHARALAERCIADGPKDAPDFVVEIASNDGYLLKNFVQAGVRCLGIEPAMNVAAVALEAGVPTVSKFFGLRTASEIVSEHGRAGFIIACNVFAHAPDPNDFVAGMRELLQADGRIILEFPYAVDLLSRVEFDTIYHEHVFYLTLTPLLPLFERHDLQVFHIERVPIHGGSLRVFVCHGGARRVEMSVARLLAAEKADGVDSMACYEGFERRAKNVMARLKSFLEEQHAAGKRVAAYGASAKGSTLLNCIGNAAKSIEFIADRSPHKHGRLSPGLHIPVVPADELAQRAPDFALLLAWNFAAEIMRQQAEYLEGGGKFVIPLPELRVVTSAVDA